VFSDLVGGADASGVGIDPYTIYSFALLNNLIFD